MTLREKIMELIAQPRCRQAMGGASLAFVRNEINIKTMVDSFLIALSFVTNHAQKAK